MSALTEIVEAFKKKVTADGGMSFGILSFILDGAGVVRIDASRKPNRVSGSEDVSHADGSDCVVRMKLEALKALIRGEVSGTDAVENGEITVVGDLRVVMAFGPAVGDLPRFVNEMHFPFVEK